MTTPLLLPSANTNYYMRWDSIKLGDVVEWRHQKGRKRGRIVALLDGGVEAKRPAGVKAVQWKQSKAYIGCRRAVVHIEDDPRDDYYVVTYHRLAWNEFYVKGSGWE